jgi:hypothetical protein
MIEQDKSRIVKPEAVLLAADLRLRRSIAAPDASPFLSHHNFDDGQKERKYAAVRSIVRSDVQRFIQLFRAYPLVCSWVIATAVAESYGHDGDTRIYDHVLSKIGCSSISPHHRQDLSREFRKTCLRFGLPIVHRVSDRNESFVDDYVVQAGVAHNQLQHLAAAFLRGELEFGPPPVDDTIQLSAWAQDSVQQFIATNLPRPRRVIEHDDVGYHAAVFARILTSTPMNSPFELAFSKCLLEARKHFSLQTGKIAPRSPGLVFADGKLSLENPNLGLAIEISINGRDRTLSPGSRLALGSPWPTSAIFRVGDVGPNIMDIVETGEVLAFDTDSGRLLRRIKPDALAIAIDAVEVVLVCPQSFEVGEDASHPVGPCAFCASTRLKPSTSGYSGISASFNSVIQKHSSSRDRQARPPPPTAAYAAASSRRRRMRPASTLANIRLFRL